ncbi:MAG TPA: lytic transglycosylase domain-containing protein [Pyrinomonadaceae bacterium]|nr:lytic transglycosylase domain-containing protein [Pyrinomonadaceae bacterium]
MRFPRKFPRSTSALRSAKFAPYAIITVFFLTNFTGFFFSPVMAPVVDAAARVETIPADIPLSGDCDLDWIIFRAGEKEGVDPRFIHAVIKQESRYDTHAVSHVGAEGLMQMMPATAKRFGLKDPFDPQANVEAGTKYLKWLLKRFDGDVSLALAGYNAGEGSVDKYKGVPPYTETQNYVKKIVSDYGKTYHPMLPPDDAKLAFHLVAQGHTSESQMSTNGL